MNIVVLCGGISPEREISIQTGKNVCKALRRKGHCAIVIDVYCGNPDIDCEQPFPRQYDVDAEIEKISSYNGRLAEFAQKKEERGEGFFGANVLQVCKKSDVVFMALHGENGEDGKVQTVLEFYDVRYTGSGPLGSGIAMDKGITKDIFQANGIPTPKGVRIQRGEATELADYGLSIPCVVKPCCCGSSVGVSLVFREEDYPQALEQAFQYGDEIIVEEYIKGRELGVGVIGDRALPVIEIVPKTGFYDYTNKYQPGMTEDICPAQLPEEITVKMQQCAQKVTKVLRLSSYSRMDFILDENNQMYCLEANTLPGMTDTSLLPQEAAALGYSYDDLCELLIQGTQKESTLTGGASEKSNS